MNAIFDRVIREFFPDTNIPHWKKWVSEPHLAIRYSLV